MTIEAGFWAGRRRFNREVLIPDGERRLREAGTFDNLRAAASGHGRHRGLVYQDSDLHKWVEALGWELRNGASPRLQRMADEVTALLTAAVNPEAQRTWMELLFLSFTTLSSTGLSDVVPIDPFARSIVMIEQLVGVAYIAVVVSRLVALTIPRVR